MSITHLSTPAADGFRMPAEWEPHRGCWMLWPSRPDSWREGAMPAQRAFAEVAAAIALFEPVSVGADAGQYEFARAALPPRVRVVELSSNDAWMRDVGPTCVVGPRGLVRGVDWHFNAWGGQSGGLYFPWDQDDLVARKVLEVEGLDRYRAPIVMEGGAIHSDGAGTLLVTEQCLLDRNRNPRVTGAQIEAHLKAYTGARHVIWLGDGVFNDETDGHVDNLACFVAPGEVALVWTDDRGDPQYPASRDALERLAASRDARGRRLRVHRLPMPGPLYRTRAEARGLQQRAGAKPRHARERLAGSYINYYVANGGVVVPLLDPAHDAAVLAKLRRLYPGRRVVGVAAREILLGGGNIHCITQQIPAGARRLPKGGEDG
jgi:agmatine deiminase